MFFDETQSIPSAHTSAIALVPSSSLYTSPRLQIRRFLSCQYLIGTRFHWRCSPPPFITPLQLQGHLSCIYFEGGKQINTLVSSLEFHLVSRFILHTTSHPHSVASGSTLIYICVLKTYSHSPGLDRPLFCYIANAGLASNSLY